MHEMSVAQQIIEIVRQHVPGENGQRVRKVHVRIGEYAGIVSESLEFCFTALSDTPPMNGAVLAIEKVPARANCRACGASSSIEITSFQCESCGSTDLTLTSGNELQIVEIELAEPGDADGKAETP